MASCECNQSCIPEAKFDALFVAAAHELRSLNSRKNDLDAEQYWAEFDIFYYKYPSCVIEALDNVLMDRVTKSRTSEF